jgi:hypothetical protein
MSQDNTFKALKRTPFKQMFAIWLDSAGAASHNFYEQYGWTSNEFWIEYNKRRND